MTNFGFSEIPDYEESKARFIVDTYRKMLVNQSKAEGRGQLVRVEFDDEKFFFEAGVNHPLFISHAKKNPCKPDQVVNQRSCTGIQ